MPRGLLWTQIYSPCEFHAWDLAQSVAACLMGLSMTARDFREAPLVPAGCCLHHASKNKIRHCSNEAVHQLSLDAYCCRQARLGNDEKKGSMPQVSKQPGAEARDLDLVSPGKAALERSSSAPARPPRPPQKSNSQTNSSIFRGDCLFLQS